MLPANKPITYLSLKCVISNFSFGKRMKLCAISKKARLIRKEKEDTLRYVELRHVLNAKDSLQMMYIENKSRVFEGTLSVEGIEWKFTYDKTTRKVTIECSLNPEKSKIVDDREVIRKYFLYFMSKPVKHLKLKNCVDPFRGINTELRCPRLTWNLNRMKRKITFEGIQNHVFDKLTVMKLRFVPDSLKELPFRNAKKLIVKKNLSYNTYEEALLDFLMDISGNLCQVTLKRCVADIFLWLCDIHHSNEYLVGSFSTAELDNSAIISDYIWQHLKDHGFREKLFFNNKECIVLKRSADGSVTIVIQNYEYEDDEFQTFTVMKLATNDMNRIE